MVSPFHLLCSGCGNSFSLEDKNQRCMKCGGTLEYSIADEYLKEVRFTGPMTFWRYRPVMPPVAKPISLGEGGTPLWKAERLGDHVKLDQLTLKDETRNPTNSFKDRSASLLVSDAVGKGFDSLVCASSGNHGASLAAYSTKEDVSCHLIVPRDLDLGKLTQMIAYDADVSEAADGIEDAIEMAVDLAAKRGWYQATTELNPLSIEASKTISYEVTEQGGVPHCMVVAMGSGATIYAIWKGFTELEVMGIIDWKPRLIGVQASGCSPITQAFEKDLESPAEMPSAQTIALAIKIQEPRYGAQALRSLRESGGLSVSVTDEEMMEFGKEIARSEGIFAEPASAATVACLPRLIEDGIIDRSDSVVSLITSSGLKTNDILSNLNKKRKSPGSGSRLATKERLLKEISRKETYGYALWNSLQRRMTLGAVYQHLSDLEERGLVESYMEGKRRYMRITEKGAKVLKAMDELSVLL
ncbi:MAG TPA: threonine synthase [Patescibacteria group bacterium]|nr:threonine synthase [Patescibacteria group bacterium]